MRGELDLPPDAAVIDLVAEIRAASAALSTPLVADLTDLPSPLPPAASVVADGNDIVGAASTVVAEPVRQRSPRPWRRRAVWSTGIAALLALGVVTLFVVSALISASVALLPGDFAKAILGQAATPDTVAAFTINKVCGSGLKAVMLAAQAIRAGDAGLIVAAGGKAWAEKEADDRLAAAAASLDGIGVPDDVRAEFLAIAEFITARQW